MVANAYAVAQPRPTQVVSYMRRGAAISFTNLVRIPYGQLTSGTSGGYSIVAFGHVGKFVSTSGTDKYVLVGLRWDNGSDLISSTITRIPIYAPLYQNGTTPLTRNTGHPWMVVYHVGAGTWPATTDMVVSATVEQVSAPSGSPGTFWSDATTAVVFDHTKTTCVTNQLTATNVLPYSDTTHVVALDGTVLPSTGRWMTFYSAQQIPALPVTLPPRAWHHVWLSKLDSGVVDVTYGVNGRSQITGCAGRTAAFGSIPADHEVYSVGGWRPIDVAGAATKLQVRGWTFVATATAWEQASTVSASMLSVKQSDFTDAISDAVDVVPSCFMRAAWTATQTETTDIGDDRPKHYVMANMTMHDSVNPTITSAATYLNVDGFPQVKFPSDALQTRIEENGGDYMPNFAGHLAETTPWTVRYPQSFASTTGLLNPYENYGADCGGSYSLFAFTPSNDADRTIPPPRTITYTAITLNGEIDATALVTLNDDDMPAETASIGVETGLQTFTTEDGHVIRWPMWSRSRRTWRVSWLCDQGRYATLFAKLYTPSGSQFVTMPPAFRDAPSGVVRVEPGTLTAEQVGSNLVWRVSAIITEVVYNP